MKRLLLALIGCGLSLHTAYAANLFSPNDFIIAIDTDPAAVRSQYPLAEAPFFAFDGASGTKYLNFAGAGSGVVINAFLNPNAIVRSLQFTTAGDAVERDPASYELFGTNDALCSFDDFTGMQGDGVTTGSGDGNCEDWTLISAGDLSLPDMRQTAGDVISFPNSTMYSSYKIGFPTLKDEALANSMQIAEIGLFQSVDGSGNSIVDDLDDSRAFGPVLPNSSYPAAESPEFAIDGVQWVGPPATGDASKYVNFGKENSGFIITPSAGASIVDGFEMFTANDFEGRDPASYELYGTNDAICSTDNSQGDCESWTLITSGSLTLPTERNVTDTDSFSTGVVPVSNTEEYASYRFLVTGLKDTNGDGIDSSQFSDIQFFGEVTGSALCDLNGDLACDVTDLRDLYDDIDAGTADNADIDAWLASAGAQNGRTYLPGDTDLDGSVGGGDFTTLASNFGNSGLPGGYWDQGNFDGNAGGSFTVGGSDFTGLASNFGSTSVSAIPEPGTITSLLFGFGFLLLNGTRRRR